MDTETCRDSGKIKHESEQRALDSIIRQPRKDNSYLRAYKCPFCYEWHLTSKKK